VTIPASLPDKDNFRRSCFSKQIDTARRTKSFIRNGTSPAMAGKPAVGSHSFGKNGMIVRVVKKVMLEPSAPRIPSLLFQNPEVVPVV
jgi:hypothetical protein